LAGGFDTFARRPIQRGAYVECSPEPEDCQEEEEQDRQHNRGFKDFLSRILLRRRP